MFTHTAISGSITGSKTTGSQIRQPEVPPADQRWGTGNKQREWREWEDTALGSGLEGSTVVGGQTHKRQYLVRLLLGSQW